MKLGFAWRVLASVAALTVATCGAALAQTAPAGAAGTPAPLSMDALPLAAKIAALKYLGDLDADLTFTPVTPCRLADTRSAGGALAARAPRAFSATSAAQIAAAGGNAAGCGIPAGPAALALTITAIVPSQVGNLIAYADGTSLPNTSALNFVAGQVVANTTVVPSSANVGNNFDLFNNSDGVTDVAVDVVGYFYAPTAPDCIAVTQPASSSASATFNVTAVCATGYRISSGGCATTATVGGTDWRSATFNATNDGWVCAGQNSTGQSVTITSEAFCCRKPGR